MKSILARQTEYILLEDGERIITETADGSISQFTVGETITGGTVGLKFEDFSLLIIAFFWLIKLYNFVYNLSTPPSHHPEIVGSGCVPRVRSLSSICCPTGLSLSRRCWARRQTPHASGMLS